jgi:hypothetical protein
MEEEGVWILITEGLSEAEAILGMIVESRGIQWPTMAGLGPVAH